MKKRLKYFLAGEYLVFLALFVFLYLFYRYEVSYIDVLFFTCVLLATSNISLIFNTRSKIYFSIILPVLLPAIILLGPFWAALIAFIGSYEFGFKNFVWYKFLFNRTMFFIAAGTASLVYQYSQAYFDLPFFTLPLLFALLSYFLINTGLVYAAVQLASDTEQSKSVLLYFMQLAKNLITSYFLGLVFYFSYIQMGKVVFFMEIVLIYILKDFLYSRIQQLNSFTQIVESFLKVIDSKDHYTQGHCERVARYTEIICLELGLRRGKIERITNMAKIHDIGKISVKDSILKSSDLLTNEQYEEMKEHSRYGYELLQDIDILSKDLDIILYHHERYDGTGYPEGLSGKEIPLGARILSACDAFDVMVTGRSYKPALNKKQVIREFTECAGTQFDPGIAEKIIEIINKGKFDDFFPDRVKEETELSFKPSLNLNS